MLTLEIDDNELTLLVSMLEAGAEQVGAALSITGGMIPKDELAFLGQALSTMRGLSDKLAAARLFECEVSGAAN